MKGSDFLLSCLGLALATYAFYLGYEWHGVVIGFVSLFDRRGFFIRNG
ncbi:MAG: hypothetical protein GDA50_00295 [Alphaproteobacteria bacterium GM202ARS2]|nr:hypothetical protein [Alphaproteobacteria bacterium GM202ARS2]